jgi:hypothetical protein
VPAPRNPLRKFPITAPHRVAKLLDEVQATVIVDRNDHHEIRLLDDAINPAGAVAATNRVLTHPHPPVLVDYPRAGSLDVRIFVCCHSTIRSFGGPGS